MRHQEIEPFRRKLNGVPNGHQEKFLYLPLAIFRDHTNIRSIVTTYGRRKDGKRLKEIEIKHKIEKIHRELGQLDQWKKRHLGELYFDWT